MTATTSTAAPAQVDIWDADAVQYLLHNSFDPTTPPGWGEKAVELIEREFASKEQEFDTIFWSKWFVRAMLLFSAILLGLSFPK